MNFLEKIFSPSPKKGRTFIIGAKKITTKAAGELFPSLVLKKSWGIFSSDKDDILLGNHPREVARQLIKQGFRLGNSSVCHPIWGWITSVEGDRFDYHHSFKRAQIADPGIQRTERREQGPDRWQACASWAWNGSRGALKK